jgi:hypothetical protein
MVMSQCSSQVHDSVCTTAAETVRCSLIVSAGYSMRKNRDKGEFPSGKIGQEPAFFIVLFVSRHCNSDSISDQTISSQRGELWPMNKSPSEGSPGEVASLWCVHDGGMTCSPIF